MMCGAAASLGERRGLVSVGFGGCGWVGVEDAVHRSLDGTGGGERRSRRVPKLPLSIDDGFIVASDEEDAVEASADAGSRRRAAGAANGP